MQLEPSLQGLDVAFDGVGFVRRMSIDDQEHLARAALHEVLEECNKGLRIQFSSVGGGPKIPSCRDGADDVDALPLS